MHNGTVAKSSALVNATLFVIAAIAAWVAVGPILGSAAALAGVPTVAVWAFGTAYSLLLLALTTLMVRRDGDGLSAVGLVPTGRRFRELALGFLVGAALFAALALVRGATTGATWTFAGWQAVPAACTGLAIAFVLLLPEELIFRGYAFQRIATVAGAWPAILISALLFGLYHQTGSGMWGIGAFFQFAMPALGGIVFGWAAVRTRGLALPIGLHLGGNWIQASVMSFRPAIGRPSPGLFTAYLTDTQLSALSAPELSEHLPYIAAMLTASLAVWAVSHSQGQPRCTRNC